MKYLGITPRNTPLSTPGSVDNTVIVWDLESGDKLLQSVCHSSFVYGIALHGKDWSRRLLSLIQLSISRLRSLDLSKILGLTQFNKTHALVPDDTLVTCSSDKTCKVWGVRSGKVRTINVIPVGNQEKLDNWSPQQV